MSYVTIDNSSLTSVQRLLGQIVIKNDNNEILFIEVRGKPCRHG